MVTSPPVSPSPSKERGNYFLERLRLSLTRSNGGGQTQLAWYNTMYKRRQKMDNVLENYKEYPDLTEAYEVVKTVDIVYRRKMYRIEVVKCYSNSPVNYEVGYWKRESVVLQQADRTGGKFDHLPEDQRIFVRADLPDVHSDNSENALRQALGFLTDRGR
jgi:hypothetical protein